MGLFRDRYGTILEAFWCPELKRFVVPHQGKYAWARWQGASLVPAEEWLADWAPVTEFESEHHEVNYRRMTCTGCEKSVDLQETEPGYYTISPLNGWTAPPLRCPECSMEKS